MLTWVECFNSYIAVMTTFFPTRSRDLLAFMALIIRTAKRFGGMSWLSYDRAFRSEAATSDLRDSSLMKPDLYDYHCTAAVHRPSKLHGTSPFSRQNPRGFRQEPRGEPSSQQLCISWNEGSCISPRERCRFRHSCSVPGCEGPHRRIDHRPSPSNKRNRSPDGHLRSRRAFSK